MQERLRRLILYAHVVGPLQRTNRFAS